MDACTSDKITCIIRLVNDSIQNYFFHVNGTNAWYFLVVDHDKEEEFLSASKGIIDLNNYGEIIISGVGTEILEEVLIRHRDIFSRFKDDFLLIRWRKSNYGTNYFEHYYVLANPGKKQEVLDATSSEEIKQHGKILYYTKHEDPPEAILNKILKGYFVDQEFFISHTFFTMVYNDADSNGWTSLHFKAYKGEVPILSDLKHIHAQDTICGKKPVHVAVREGHGKMVEYFLNNGASVNEVDKSGWTLLHYAVWKGNVSLVKLLIQKNANINAKDKCMGKGPLHVAAERGHTDVLKILLDNGADVNDVDGSGRTPLYYSVWEGCLTTAKYLVSKGADVNIANKHANKPIHIAAEVDNMEMIEFLLTKGAGIEDKDRFGKTALHLSALVGMLNNVRYLVQHGANLNAIDNDGKTPLALGKKHTEVATYLAGKMRNMCDELYDQHQYSQAMDILRDIYDNSGLNCEHLHALRNKCLLGVSLNNVDLNYNEAVEVLRAAFQTGENSVSDFHANGNTAYENKSFQLSGCISTRSNCFMIFCIVILVICRFLISYLEPGEPL